MSGSIDRKWRRRTLKDLEVRDGDLVLDIASGTGDMALQAVTMARCEVVGIDLSKNMLRTARAKWRERGNGSPFPVLQGDAVRMPFRDGSFDKAMVAFGVRNMIDVNGFLAEAYRVLRPGGRLAVVELSVPRYPVIREATLLYLTRLMPLVVKAQRGDASSYRYLCDSILTFPPPATLGEMMRDQGFHVKVSREQTLGVCHIYILERGGP
jgi:demethylmenaquinone methyltransferase/2-methoxy-6-polyprenyl-1,4-benzoquinol methylase